MHRDTERPKELHFTHPGQSNPLCTCLMQIRQERTRERVPVLKENVNTVGISKGDTAEIYKGLLQP